MASKKSTTKQPEKIDLDSLKIKYLERKNEYELQQVTDHIEYKKILLWLEQNDKRIG